MSAPQPPAGSITVYRDGPLIVRGDVDVRDQDGNPIDPGRRPYALCRCGKSRIRPFCDGSHATVRFHAPTGREHGRTPGAASGAG